MQRRHLTALCAASLLAAAGTAFAEGYGRGNYGDPIGPVPPLAMGMMSARIVGGAPMYPALDIVENAMHSRVHTTLVAAVKAAGLVDTLKMAGPYTVFAPTDSAFAALPAGTVDSLLKPENKGLLAQVLTYHVVPGRIDAATLAQQVRAGGGKTMLKTASGGTLWATLRGDQVVLRDAQGNTATITTGDVFQSNGVIHVVDHVLMPS